MDKKRAKILFSGILFLIGAIFIASSQSGATAAVVGVSHIYGGVLYITGMFMVISAFVIFSGGRTLEHELAEEYEGESIDTVSAEAFGERIRRKEPDHDKRIIVIDTSAIIKFTPEEVRRMLSGEHAYTTQSVLHEIHSNALRGAVDSVTDKDVGYAELRKVARGYLEQTPKHKLYHELMPLLDERLRGKKLNYDRTEIYAFQRDIRLLLDLAGKGVIHTDQGDILMLLEAKRYLEDHCRVSDADVDVLATALHVAKNNPLSHIIIAARDTDFREAINIIKHNNPSVGKRLDYESGYS